MLGEFSQDLVIQKIRQRASKSVLKYAKILQKNLAVTKWSLIRFCGSIVLINILKNAQKNQNVNLVRWKTV